MLKIANMADIAAARREARRRRILENSHNRLQLIAGKCADDCSKELSIVSHVTEENSETQIVPESTNSSGRSSLNNGVLVNEPETFEFPPVNQIDATGDGEISNELAAFFRPTPEPAQTQVPSPWEKLITFKYDIVLLSLLIQLLYALSLITFESTYFFLPLIMYVITKLIWFPPQKNSNLTSIFLLCGIPLYKVQAIMNTMQWVSVITQDVFVYMFVTICIQSLYVTLRDTLIT